VTAELVGELLPLRIKKVSQHYIRSFCTEEARVGRTHSSRGAGNQSYLF
jgi:hypothetical protein